MDMSGSCPNPLPEMRPVRGPHGGWKQQEIDALTSSISQAEASGESLRSVFDRLAVQLGRKPNSIRNFYYAQIRAQPEEGNAKTLPFETFSQEEIESLIRHVLTARAQGISVRACVRSMADGDHTRMLRLQNKYRSTVRTRPELIRSIMRQLDDQGIAYVDPYTAEDPRPGTCVPPDIPPVLSDDEQLSRFFEGLHHLLSLAAVNRTASPAADDAPLHTDRLKVRCDMLRIALDDSRRHQERLEDETRQTVSLIKEFIALSEADRLSHCQAFCLQAAERLGAVECALLPSEEDLPIPDNL